ncbi:MAG: hypothetical protein LBC80_02050 [Treponema sp.]|jgi:hypothetical protein|nr:hypothetical protein [Treponema sp.]
MQTKIAAGLSGIFMLFILACPIPDNEAAQKPVGSIEIFRNQLPVPSGGFSIIEGQAVVLGAKLAPQGVPGSIHWQSSSRGIVELSGFSGPQIIITGNYGGKTVISVLARNIHNEVNALNECIIEVIPRSFFKWNFRQDGWDELLPLSNNIVGKISETLIRTGTTTVAADTIRGGLVLDGAGASLAIGSVLATATNSPFENDPVYDKYGQFNFLEGPSGAYPLWAGRVRVSVDYEILDTSPGKSLLRIQVNNNTTEQENASAISNWLVAELGPASPYFGILTGVFNNADSVLVKNTGIPGGNDTERRENILSHSFVSLVLPDGKILIRSIQIESAD